MGMKVFPPVSEVLKRYQRDLDVKISRVFNRTLYFVHIGKCGGTSLRTSISTSSRVRRSFRRIRVIHFARPPRAGEKAKYLIAVRNPIRRSLSAFNYRKVKLAKGKPEKISGELKSIARWKSFSQLAEALYAGGKRQAQARADWNRIHHLGDESISYYLEELLPSISKKEVFGVITVENFESDVQRVLGTLTPHYKNFASKSLHVESQLSELAVDNLLDFLKRDFDYLKQLFDLVEADNVIRDSVMTSHRELLRGSGGNTTTGAL